jgi:hypothetical protein
MLDVLHVLGGPHFDADLIAPNGKLARLHKGGSTAGANKEARLGREQSARQFNEQMALMKQQNANSEAQQQAALEAAKRPVNEPPPTSSTADTLDAATAARRMASKRKGMRYSLFNKPQSTSVGAPTLLG